MYQRFRCCQERGFSLIELAIVLSMLVILGSILVISWPGDNINLKAEAEILANNLRYVQFFAMSQDTSYRVNFSSNQYTLTDLSGSTALLHPATESNIVALNKGIILSTSGLSNNYIVFDRIGIPYTDTGGSALADDAVITLTGSSGSLNVIISPETGTVTIS